MGYHGPVGQCCGDSTFEALNRSQQILAILRSCRINNVSVLVVSWRKEQFVTVFAACSSQTKIRDNFPQSLHLKFFKVNLESDILQVFTCCKNNLSASFAHIATIFIYAFISIQISYSQFSIFGWPLPSEQEQGRRCCGLRGARSGVANWRGIAELHLCCFIISCLGKIM